MLPKIRRGAGVVIVAVATILASSCGGNVETSGPLTLENVCDRTPAMYCAQDRPCCEKAHFPFDRTACEAFYRKSCLQSVARVRSGVARFHPEAVDECLRSIQPFYDKCALDEADGTAFNLAVRPCYQEFAGTVPFGEPCADFVDCKGTGPNPGDAQCDGGSCVVVPEPLKEGASCVVGPCAIGLTCDTASLTCMKAPASDPSYPVYAGSCSPSPADDAPGGP